MAAGVFYRRALARCTPLPKPRATSRAPAASRSLIESFDALAEAYLARVTWEAPAVLEARAASLLPGLLLARVDGKSPVEYLTTEIDKATVRAAALPLLARAPTTLAEVAATWTKQLTAR